MDVPPHLETKIGCEIDNKITLVSITKNVSLWIATYMLVAILSDWSYKSEGVGNNNHLNVFGIVVDT